MWVDGYLKPFGCFETYNPFDHYQELYSSFYTLLNRVMNYRRALFYTEGRKVKREKYNRNINFAEEKKMLQDEYKRFAEQWGLLGLGFSRIFDISNEYVTKNGDHAQCGNPVYIYLKHEPDIFSFDTNEDYTHWISLLPDNLPEEGGVVDINSWKNDYFGLSRQDYCESLSSLAASYDVLRIWNDIAQEVAIDSGEKIEYKPFEFFSKGMTATDGGISWRFNSLIQAISIIHALNKSSKLEINWRICPMCRRIYEIGNRRKIYCSETCKNRATKRRQRIKGIENQPKMDTDNIEI